MSKFKNFFKTAFPKDPVPPVISSVLFLKILNLLNKFDQFDSATDFKKANV